MELGECSDRLGEGLEFGRAELLRAREIMQDKQSLHIYIGSEGEGGGLRLRETSGRIK